MTMRELAKLANVSLSTVSKAFSDAEDISEETKEHIFEIAKKTGCYGKFYRGKYSKKIIALICPELYGDHYVEYLERLQKILEANNCIVLISSSHFDTNKQSELLEYYCSYLKVDGIIVFSLREPLKKAYDVPIVSLFNSHDSSVDTVEFDVTSAFSEAISLLKKSGHKKIAFIGEKLTRPKAEMFSQEMKARSLMDFCIITSKYRFEKAGEDGIKQLLSQRKDCTAVICAYDNIAFGAIKQLKRSGYRVPEDFSVIGINNIDVSEYTETALTTIDTDPEKTCELAWELLKNKLENKYFHNNKQLVVEGKLVVRDTVAKAR